MDKWLAKWNEDDEESDLPDPDEGDDFGETHVLPSDDDEEDFDPDYDEEDEEDE